ncbi:hypothetical protein DICPUDRAFT_39985 [Dictyostelium purpureum]|uniref:CCHC-type domain-containing protein n=1 Tax=Dictyostelium purpureum TaxID=5786 RepID=F0ZXC2_DICPU|nr:uncharacterized protein DICPUDRAFT_39985 [Dictyostelium purpureum]EGC31396.1 hypothetical protein DICPUDRAFT_39985 [Dictyostelium purpureum]|eukprot:XP_003292066.1 hypothetical protein DICPUDRAFT_39985 [Dictyostelium purpureum]
MSNNNNLNIRYNKSGYRQYQANDGGWEYTHRTVAEKKIGRPIEPNEHVHHINKNKVDNRPSNLVVIKDNIHREVHRSDYNEKNSCFNCGRTSHWAQDCYASYDIDGNRL